MLTRQHRFAASLVQDKQSYKTHMCGLCHALGDGYGLISRLLTSHEMILLSLLTSAQRETDLQTVKRRCPLNPTRFVSANQDEGSTFAAAAAVELARVSVLDDVQDSRGWDVLAQVSRLLIGSAHQTAVRTLENLGFDPATFARLTEYQSQAEADSDSDPAAPTAMTSASLFAMTARLAQKPDNESALAAIGASLFAFVPNLLSLGVIVGVAWFFTRVVERFAEAVAQGHLKLSWLHADLARPTRRIVTFFIWVVALVMGHPYLPGSESRAFQGVAVVFGVLISLGSSSVVGNALAGLVLTYSRAYRTGDRIRIGDTVGDVVELGPFNTRLRTTKDEEVIVPNAVVMGGSVVNYSRFAHDGGVQISAKVTIGYDAPWRTVHRLLVTAAARTQAILPAPAPYVLQTSLDDFYVSYEVRAYCDRPRELHLVSAELNQNIQDTFFAEGVEICSPHYEAFRDGNASTIPGSRAHARAVDPRPHHHPEPEPPTKAAAETAEK
ncbi:MAG: mechanosensitive ion channel family protein [Bryobacteraceae bacterium]|nr:mechanosensitive ion channel family protein [Bryobacteraceae bacterium]